MKYGYLEITICDVKFSNHEYYGGRMLIYVSFMTMLILTFWLSLSTLGLQHSK